MPAFPVRDDDDDGDGGGGDGDGGGGKKDWFGLRTEIFNAGNYRRKFPEGRNASADLFDPMNAEVGRFRCLD